MFECKCGYYIDLDDMDYTDLDFEIVCNTCKRKYKITVKDITNNISCAVGIIEFGYRVLKSEGINNYNIITIEGNEGYCNKDTHKIHIGVDAIKQNLYNLMLHEIAHILTDAYHYSDEFESIVERLNDTYLK